MVKQSCHIVWLEWQGRFYGSLTEEEQKLEIDHFVLRHERRFKKLRQQLEAYRKLERAEASRREESDGVRLFVWQRDEGKCVKCGSQERLEFDHIIPVALGGSNTERNIQLLCEICNRSKAQMYYSQALWQTRD